MIQHIEAVGWYGIVILRHALSFTQTSSKSGYPKILGDCYTVLRSSQISPEELLLTLNSINPSIQFTMEFSKDQIPFLDILKNRNENSIWMDLYHKCTDTQKCLLPFTSSHPKHEEFVLFQKIAPRN